MEKLLEILETNPRLSNREIAVMLGKTEEEVEAQIRLYEETGIIKGYRAMIDKNKAKEFSRKNRQVACITYTNAAVDVIKNRISSGSSIKICLVAEGKADVYPRFAPTMEWDTAAGHAIARAAGMEVYQAGKEEPLRYNKEDLLNPWFIVEPKREH